MSTIAYFHTWCDLSANLECRSEMCCTWLAENTGRKNDAKKSPSGLLKVSVIGLVLGAIASENSCQSRSRLLQSE